MKTRFLDRYCDRYAESLAQSFAACQSVTLPRQYGFVLCVPAYDETPDFIAPLLDSIQADVLVILVFNAPQQSKDLIALQTTQAAMRSLISDDVPLTLVSWTQTVDVLVVNCCTPGKMLPKKEGVGLARKIAGDLAVAAIANYKIHCPWICCTDADVQLPPSYFEAVPTNDDQSAAALFPFVHFPSHNNILQYEISLRYYVLQLARIGSPYAFQTIGSSMATHAQRYAAVRGFPKRNAAEDFYILNKLAKTGAMVRLDTQPLVLSSRRSHRVPFGTGAAMNRLHDDPVQQFYHPDIFVHLGQWLQQIERMWDDRDRLQEIGLEVWWTKHPTDCEWVLTILLQQGLSKVVRQAFRQCHDRAHFCYYLHVWFDAFRTLRFIHLMRDQGFPSIEISELPELAPHLKLHDRDLASINHQLTQQEATLPSQVGPTQFLHNSVQPDD